VSSRRRPQAYVEAFERQNAASSGASIAFSAGVVSGFGDVKDLQGAGRR